ncbi:MAG: hypothetical protein Fur0010_20220 [Bdellovibrio sp.]
MCLAIPAILKEIDGTTGKVEKDGLILEVDLALIPEAKLGDALIIHAGIALSIQDPE